MAVHAGAREVGRDEAYGKRVALVATRFRRTRCTPLSPLRNFVSTSSSRVSRIPSNTRAGESTRQRHAC